MQAKQHAPEQLRREVKTCFKTNENGNIEQPKLWDAAKAVLRGQFIMINAFIKEKERS